MDPRTAIRELDELIKRTQLVIDRERDRLDALPRNALPPGKAAARALNARPVTSTPQPKTLNDKSRRVASP